MCFGWAPSTLTSFFLRAGKPLPHACLSVYQPTARLGTSALRAQVGLRAKLRLDSSHHHCASSLTATIVATLGLGGKVTTDLLDLTLFEPRDPTTSVRHDRPYRSYAW